MRRFPKGDRKALWTCLQTRNPLQQEKSSHIESENHEKSAKKTACLRAFAKTDGFQSPNQQIRRMQLFQNLTPQRIDIIRAAPTACPPCRNDRSCSSRGKSGGAGSAAEYGVRTQVEQLVHRCRQLVVRNNARAHCVDEQAHRARDANGIRQLNFAALRQPRRDDVLRNVARRIRRRAVNLRRVFAGERAAAVRGIAAVGINENLGAWLDRSRPQARR